MPLARHWMPPVGLTQPVAGGGDDAPEGIAHLRDQGGLGLPWPQDVGNKRPVKAADVVRDRRAGMGPA
jgi:hypothetical protein